MQSPTGYTGIYRDWNADLDNADRNDDDATGAEDFWDFGTSSQYPALKVDFDGDGTATAAEFGGQHGDAPAPTPLVFIEGANGEYDADGDRLIEISNLEQLNAVRYDLSDGNGRPDDSDDARAYRAAFPTSAGESVCDRACRGYELTSSLDFNSPDSYSAGAVDTKWTRGDGWLPINDNRSGLNAEFEGNGHTISNLYIHRQGTDSVGLFARVGGSGIILNAGVVNAEMEGSSYAGILAGSNSGTITASYATGSVSGRRYVGGLVGNNSSGGAITASYATGSVSGRDNFVGGLVGLNGGAITASYATGSVSGGSSVGGLVGYNSSGGAITASYWNTDIFGAGTHGEGRTTAQLQSPTGYTGIYRDWNADLDNADRDDDDATGADDFWDFGTSSQYPALKVDFDGDGAATAAEFGGQRPTPPPPGAPTAMAQGPTQIDLSWSGPSDNGGAPVTAYDLRYIETGAADKSDANWTVVEDVWAAGSGSLQYTLSGLTGGTQYDVQVRAVNAAGDGAWSATVTGTTTSAVTGGDSLIDRYDGNGNNMIDKAEVIEAINDYLFGAGDEAISKAEVIELINLYLFG